MSFSPDWLDLREPADRAARDPALLAEAVRFTSLVPEAPLVDLGCGTGATLRAFGADGARWRLVDHDPVLLARAALRTGGEPCVADLGALDQLPLVGARMVTASALLDLMPLWWIQSLADRLALDRIGAYAALSYDGTLEWGPSLPGDARIRAAFNRHQLRDKGLGPALGPAAATVFAEAMERRGYEVRLARSPWRLGPGQAALMRELNNGIAMAAGETGLAEAGGWAQARRASGASGRMLVGHVDVLALPRGSSTQSKITSLSRP